MQKLAYYILALFIVALADPSDALARRGGGSRGGGRSHGSGGGHYKGGRGSSHKGGSYKRKATNDHYRKRG